MQWLESNIFQSNKLVHLSALLNFASICCLLFMLLGIPGNLFTILALARCKKVRRNRIWINLPSWRREFSFEAEKVSRSQLRKRKWFYCQHDTVSNQAQAEFAEKENFSAPDTSFGATVAQPIKSIFRSETPPQCLLLTCPYRIYCFAASIYRSQLRRSITKNGFTVSQATFSIKQFQQIFLSDRWPDVPIVSADALRTGRGFLVYSFSHHN